MRLVPYLLVAASGLLFLFGAASAQEEEGVTLAQCMFKKGQGVILGFVAAWAWAGGHLWQILQNFSDEMPFLAKIPVVSTDALSSVAVGFLIEWLLIERLIKRVKIGGN